MKRATDKLSKAWSRNKSDMAAVRAGCWFDVRRGAYVVWWIERYCKLYEGEFAGQPLTLRGCHKCNPKPVAGEWFNSDGSDNVATVAKCIARAESHAKCVKAGHAIDWQYDCLMRLFGWVRHSEQWGRAVRRFRKASIWVSKKNKKSPTLAAIGLYLLCGDGEPGQKVFFGAKDGTQSREIAGKHAIEMLRTSPELDADCTVNKNLMQITHEPSRSILKPMSSSNERTQQSKEGLNGSILIDETHVVDREFIGRISRAGISRSEPLQAEFSTAGNNPDGYGKERFDHAVRVIAGDVEDQSLFAAVYAAPQDLSDEDLEADPLAFARMANPAMGHTVDPEEFLEDYQTSKIGSHEDFARFKMYRLNVWQKTGSPWIKESAWQACAGEYDVEDMRGQVCHAGLDLSKVYDTTSLVLVFPPTSDRNTYRLLPFFWLPKETAERLADKVPLLDWGKAGAIELTPNNWIDYAFIRERLNWARDYFDLRQMVFDTKFSSELVQQLLQEDGWAADQVQAFAQTDMEFAAPTSEFERLLLAKEIEHPNNPVLNWQAGHVIAPQNPRTKIKRAQKPKASSHLTVDGIVASIMGLGSVMACPDAGPSIYSTPGQLQL